VLLAGCLRTTTFPCASDAECGTGTCESVGFCSFADTACTDGRRFGEHSGPYSGQCVGEVPGDDGGVVDGATDAAPDAFVGCGTGYVTITGGEAGHRYRLRATTTTWDAQRTTCASEGGYLAVPNSLLELQGMIGLGASPIFVGISDLATENTWVDVNGVPATYLPWAGGQPDDDNPGEDCVRASATSFTDERCSRTARAVCECVE
jgi:hypothetical protein